MNTIDFLRESATFLVADRPDVYDHETAVEELSVAMDTLRESENTDRFTCIMFTSYAMMRLYVDGVEEFILTRKLSSVLVFEEEAEVSAYSYHPNIELQPPLDSDYED